VHNNLLIYVDPTGKWCESVDGKNSHSGRSSSKNSTESQNFEHDGDLIYSNGKVVGIYEYIEGIHEDNTWTGVAFVIIVNGVVGLGKIISTGIKKSVQKSAGLVSEAVAVKLAYKGTRNTAVDFMNKKKISTLSKHFGDHATEFGIKTEAKYLNEASNFLTKKATSTTKAFTSAGGTYFRYDTVTNEFGIINKFGDSSTYMKRVDGLIYWAEQVAKYAPK